MHSPLWAEGPASRSFPKGSGEDILLFQPNPSLQVFIPANTDWKDLYTLKNFFFMLHIFSDTKDWPILYSFLLTVGFFSCVSLVFVRFNWLIYINIFVCFSCGWVSVGRTCGQVLSCCISGCRTVEKRTEHSRVCSESLKLEMILSCLYINNLSIPVEHFLFPILKLFGYTMWFCYRRWHL